MTLETEIESYIRKATTFTENKYSDGSVNWNYVDADACMEFGKYFALIGDILNKVADEYFEKEIEKQEYVFENKL